MPTGKGVNPPAAREPVAPEIIVKGGTTSSRYDRELAERREATAKGQEHQDRQMAAAGVGDQMTADGFASARLHSLRMMDKGSPKLVLYYMNRDKTVRQECVSELLVLPTQEKAFVMMCPRCFERGVPAADAQIIVRSSNRAFYLDTRAQGTLVTLIDVDGRPFHVKLCGTVYADDILRCKNLGCTWAVKIDDSRVWEV